MTLMLKKYKVLFILAVCFLIVFPFSVFSYTRIEFREISREILDDNALKVEWTTNLRTKGNVIYGEKPGNYAFRVIDRKNKLGTRHSVVLDGLEEGKKYYFQIVAENAVTILRSEVFEFENYKRSQEVVYIDDVYLDDLSEAENLKLSKFSKKASPSEIAIDFSTNVPAEGTVTVKKKNNLLQTIALNFDSKHSVRIKRLDSSTCYNVRLDLKNSVTNKWSKNYTFCTLKQSPSPRTVAYSRTEDVIIPYQPIYPRSFQTSSGVVVAGIEYSHYPTFQTVYKTVDSDRIWLIINNQRYLIPKVQSFLNYGFDWKDVKTVAWPVIAKYKPAKLVKAANSSTVYFLHERANGTIAKIVIPSSAVFDSYSANKRSDIITIHQNDLNSYENVSLLRNISTGHLYYVSGDTKYYISDDVFWKYDFDADQILNVNTIHLNKYIPGPGLK